MHGMIQKLLYHLHSTSKISDLGSSVFGLAMVSYSTWLMTVTTLKNVCLSYSQFCLVGTSDRLTRYKVLTSSQSACKSTEYTF